MAENKQKKKKKVVDPNAVAHIKSTFNNCIVSVTDEKGNVIATSTTGEVGFKGSKKGTPYAAQLASEKAARKAVEVASLKSVDVFVKGPGAGRETAIRALQCVGLNILNIIEFGFIINNTSLV